MFDWLFGPLKQNDDWYGREYSTSRWEMLKQWLPYIAVLALFAIAMLLFVLKTIGSI